MPKTLGIMSNHMMHECAHASSYAVLLGATSNSSQAARIPAQRKTKTAAQEKQKHQLHAAAASCVWPCVKNTNITRFLPLKSTRFQSHRTKEGRSKRFVVV